MGCKLSWPVTHICNKYKTYCPGSELDKQDCPVWAELKIIENHYADVLEQVRMYYSTKYNLDRVVAGI